ncbi:MAG TPA: response regulator [Spirochaetota bacterium]|nr:response regulator [Spirochaetota bacterium]
MDYKKILIVDDSETSQMIIKRCFEMAGFDEAEFASAGDGLQALNFLEYNPVDLIVSDLNMPKMGGADLLKKLTLKENTKNIPVVIITSLQGERVREELGDMDIKGVIRKPVSPVAVNNIFAKEV